MSSSFPLESHMGYNPGRMNKRVDPHCRAFQNAVELLARPWTGLILSLLQNGPLRFSELEERTHGVGAKTLSARLKELELLKDVLAGTSTTFVLGQGDVRRVRQPLRAQ